MTDISVIVPAYNVENAVAATLDSLIAQTKQEFEVVVVNDGSRDQTAAVLAEYAARYPAKIRVITQENQGLSCTRNNGVKAANGRYVFFLDGDDRLKADALEKLYAKAVESDCDVVVCDVSCVYPDHTTVIKAGVSVESAHLTDEERKRLIESLYVSACNKLYKRALFEDGTLAFEPGIWFEDVVFFHKLMPVLGSLAYVPEAFYEYIQRENSITYTYSDKLYDMHVVVNKVREHYEQNGLMERFGDEVEYMYVRYLFATFIKRLAKSKDRKRFHEGVRFVLRDVQKTFPQYKRNPYLNNGSPKGMYLKWFNPVIAEAIYWIERNRMN